MDKRHESSSSSEEEDEEEKDVSTLYVWKKDFITKHAFFLPRDIRALLIGKSNSGKTLVLLNLLIEPDVLDYQTLTICGKSLHQPEYKLLQCAFNKKLSKSQIKTIFENQDDVKRLGGFEQVINNYHGECKGTHIKTNFIEDVALLPDPKSLDQSKTNCIVLDDVMLASQNNVEALYTRGRHGNLSVFYLSQNYFRLKRSSVRENANFILLWNQDKKNLVHIYLDHFTENDISFEKFSKFCDHVWNENVHNFVCIDKTRPMNCGRLRKNLKYYFCPDFNSLHNQKENKITALPSHLNKTR